MASSNTISLNPIGLQFLSSIGSGLAPQATGGNSFLSFLNDIKGELATGLDTAFSELPVNGAVSDVKLTQNFDEQDTDKKENDPLNAALINSLAPAAVTTKDLPLPIRLSLNLFGVKSDIKGLRPSDKKESDKGSISLPAGSTLENTDPTRWMLPALNPMPLQVIVSVVDSGSGKSSAGSEAAVASPDLPATPGLPVDPDDELSKLSAPRVNSEPNPTGSAIQPPVAFALRLNKLDPTTDEQSPITESQMAAAPAASANSLQTKTQVTMPAPEVLQNNAEPVRAAKPVAVPEAPVVAPSVQPGSGLGSNAGANSGNHHSANRESDSDSGSVSSTPVSASVNGTPFHATPLVSTHEGPASASTPVSTPDVQAAPHVASLETSATAEPSTKTGAANQLSFSVSGNDQQKVEVRVTDRAGEVHVSVRTPDAELATTLRSDLGSLTGKLTQSGYTAEAFTPSAHGGELSHQQRNGSEPQADQRANQDNRGGQGRNADRQSQQQDSQQNGRYKRPAWLDEFENSLAKSPVSGFKKG